MTESRSCSASASVPSVAPEGASLENSGGELGETWFENAALWIGETLVRRGRPKAPAPKVPINIRLSRDVLNRFKATGRGWQTRINKALEQWLESHPEVG